MRLAILCIVAGLAAAAATVPDGWAGPVLGALVVAFIVYAAWFVGHEDGWTAGCIATAELRDLVTEKAEES